MIYTDTSHFLDSSLGTTVPGSEIVVKSRSVKGNAKNARGLGRDRAAEALSPIFLAATFPFPNSRASYFRFARFNTSFPYYLRAWHRLVPQIPNLIQSL